MTEATNGQSSLGDEPILVTGADGYIGRAVVQALAQRTGERVVVAADVREVPPERQRPGVTYATCDIRDREALEALVREHGIKVAVHLAAVVSPGPDADREFLHAVEVGGTENLLAACVAAGARQVIITSSGAAYGYHADNNAWLTEDDPIRGNPEFPYSDHKRQVEELLARYREQHPELGQLIFRPGTILGATAQNQITDLFDKPYVIGLLGVASPFVLIWDQDVVRAILRGIRTGATGIFNLAGDGVLTMKQMARIMGKPYVPIPVPLVATGLRLGKRFGLTQYGPEQLGFLRYRPVLHNRLLKEEFGFTPRKSTRQVFNYFLEARQHA